jgi:hypothetical protein
MPKKLIANRERVVRALALGRKVFVGLLALRREQSRVRGALDAQGVVRDRAFLGQAGDLRGRARS